MENGHPLEDLALKIAAKAAVEGVRAFFSRQTDAVERAIRTTSDLFPEVEGTKTALQKWVSSDAFIEFYERVYAGERDLTNETVASFIREGDFCPPSGEEGSKPAAEIVATFVGELSEALYLTDEGLVTVTNRLEVMNAGTKSQLDAIRDDLAELKAENRSLQAQVGVLTGSAEPGTLEARDAGTKSQRAAMQDDPAELKTESRSLNPLLVEPFGLAEGGSFADPAHAELTAQIDIARDLINEGRVNSARVVLEKVRHESETVPAEIEFRIVTNLGACALAEDDIDRARMLWEEAHRLQPDDQKGIANAAVAALLGKNLGQAEELARKARASDPRDSRATFVLMRTLWDLGKSQQFEEIVAAEDWIQRDGQCGLTLAEIRTEQSRFAEAISLCRSLIEADPEDSNPHLALAECSLAAAQADGDLPISHTDEALRTLHTAIEEATRAIDLLERTDLKTQRWRALLVRARAHTLLGATTAAMRDLDDVLGETPTHPDALFRKGLSLLDEGRPVDARAAFESIPNFERHAEVAPPLAAACLDSGDAAAAANLLKDTLSLEDPGWQDIRDAMILSRAEAEVGDEDSVGPALEIALEQHPNNPLLLSLAALRRHSSGDTDGAEDLFLEALQHAGESDRRAVLAQLGGLYQELGRFADAADRYAEAVDGVASHPSAVALLLCLNNSGQLGKALHWARRLRATHRQVSKLVLEIEVQILAHVGDARAALLCHADICSRPDATPLDRVKLASAQLRCGERDAAVETILGIDVSELRDEPQEIVKLAQLKLLLGVPDHLEDAYLARRWGHDDAEVHLGYFQLFQSRAKTWVGPEVVGPGCAVLLKNESNKQWWQIFNDGEERRGSYELPESDAFARRLLGKRVGDTVVLREGFEDLSYEIADIQSKFVRAFQETVAEFSTRFSENMDLFRVEVKDDDLTKILQSVDQRDQVAREVLRLYRERRLPFTSFSNLLGRSVLEVWRECTRTGFAQIRFATGSIEEAKKASALLSEADELVLDQLALLTVYELGLADHLRSRFSRVAVPQYVIDEMQQLVYTTRVMGPPSGHLGKDIGGQHTLTELSEEDWTSRLEYFQSVLGFAESLERIASYRVLDPNTEDFENLADVLTRAGAGWVRAGDEQTTDKLLLVSDDVGLSSVAHSLGIDAVNMQAVLEELRRSEVITDEAYSSWIERLVLLSYWFVRIDPQDIVRRLEVNGYTTTDGTWAMLRTLEGPDCTEDAAVSVGAQVIASLALKGLPMTKINLILESVIAVLQRGRKNSSVLAKFKDEIAPKLALVPFRRDPILATVDLHIRLPKG